MTRLVLGLTEDAALIAHVERCSACQTSLAAVRALNESLASAHVSLQRGHEAARVRLMEALAEEERPAERVSTLQRRTLRLGAITMRQRIAVGSVGLAAILGVLVLWNTATPASALAKMAENIRQAKSLKATIVEERQVILKT